MVAADPMEFRGIRRHLTDARAVAVPVDWARSARLGSHELMLAANGAGMKRAAAAVDACLADFRAEAIVSTGFCGALAPELADRRCRGGHRDFAPAQTRFRRCSLRAGGRITWAWFVRSITLRRPRRKSASCGPAAAARWKWKPAEWRNARRRAMYPFIVSGWSPILRRKIWQMISIRHSVPTVTSLQ